MISKLAPRTMALCLFILVGGLSIWSAYRQGYTARDGVTVPMELFNDEGGMYTAGGAVAGEPVLIRGSLWYKRISEGVTDWDFLKRWGQHSTRFRSIFQSGYYWGHGKLVASLKRVTGTYREGFRLSIVVFTFLVVLRLIALLIFAIKRNDLWPFFFSALAYDLFEVYGYTHRYHGSSAYGIYFLTSSVLVLLVSRRSVLALSGAALLAILGASMSGITAAVTVTTLGCIVFSYAILSRVSFFTPLRTFVLRHFYATSLAAVVLTPVFLVIQLRILKAVQSPLLGHLTELAYQSIVYFDPITLFLGGLVSVTLRKSKLSEVPETLFISLLVIIALYWAALGFAMTAHFFGPFTSENRFRILEYIYLAEVTAVGLLLRTEIPWKGRSFPAGKTATGGWPSVVLIVLAMNSFSQNFPSLFHKLSVHGWVYETHLKKTITPKLSYYLVKADGVEGEVELMSYFVHELFRDAPLILDIRNSKYSPESVIAELSK